MDEARRDHEVTDFEWLVLQVEALEGCSVTKERFMALLRANTGKVMRFTRRALLHPHQVRCARRQLDAGLSVAEMRDALAQQFGISQRTAYRVIAEALRLRGHERAEQLAQWQRKQQKDLFG